MATIVLSAVGAAVGGTVSGSFLGLTGAVVGRAVGATLGQVIDQRLLGSGSEPVEVGRVERFRLTGASEGAPVAQLFGRMRLGGQVIWATEFLETVSTSGGGGGKGGPRQPQTTTYAYSITLAMALCEGEILRVGRVWADGVQIPRDDLSMRVYRGTEDQMPDPTIEAVEGAGNVPAYRGIAYVVIEDLALGPFGNRVPQLSFEVIRPARPRRADHLPGLDESLRAVALIPGTGEYALATTAVTARAGIAQARALNTNTPDGGTDMAVSLEALRGEVPRLKSVALVVSWFGDDLRAGQCRVMPKVEHRDSDGAEMPWRVAGVSRAEAGVVAQIDGRPVYGGTPADAAVREAIRAIREGGQEVLFYPFVLMEILAGNGLPDPWSDAPEQPALPWRGRITGARAPGLSGSPDGTAANRDAVSAFFGTAQASDFAVLNGEVQYSGPQGWGYRRFILHYAALCAAAGGVEAFCIGTEMRGLTQMRCDLGFPAVAALVDLAAEVRLLLPQARLSYAADWSEYFGYQPQDGSGDLFFHLDPLWADPNIDFVAIDNYMPLSDWRDGPAHADAPWGSIHNPAYLMANIEGGEGYEWYYAGSEGRAAQRRLPITDGASGAVIGAIEEVTPVGPASLFANQVRAETAVFVARVQLPAAPGEGTLWTHGGASGVGVWLGLRDGGAVLRLRAGDAGGAKSGSDAQTVVLDLPVAGLPFDGGMHEIAWELRATAPARARIWLDGALLGEAGTSDGSALVGGWSGGGSSWWVQGGGPHGVAGEPEAPWPATLAGPLHRAVGAGEAPTDAAWVFRYKDIRNWWQNRHIERRGGRPLLLASDWEPRSKPVIFTEIGCGAVDKGTNQPNKFVDPKSSESALPYFSDGRRDDLIQVQYLRALGAYWGDPARNPVSPLYGGPMIDMDRAHVWAWDARPWPAFPNNRDLWSDGANHARGHWISGRISGQPLALVVAEICEAAGVTAYDVSGLHGFVRGHVLGDIETARARLQPLMLAYGFGAVEREGRLVFAHLPRLADGVIEVAETAADDEGRAGIKLTRAPEAETLGRVQVGYTEADGAFEGRMAEAVFPDDAEAMLSHSALPLSLTGTEARGIAERWLAEARVARDTLTLELPPSRRGLGAGAMIALEDGSTWRIDRVEDMGARRIEAVRVEPSLAIPSDAVEEAVRQQGFTAPVPVSPVFMDLPLLRGDEVPHAPHLAVAAVPWPGRVAVYSSDRDSGFALNTLIEAGAAVGELETPLGAATPGLWDRGPLMRVRMAQGLTLAAAEPGAVLNGANLAAIGAGDTGPWEVIQFARAELVAPGLWEIGLRLRGQAGSDADMPAIWPPGSLFVVLDAAVGQIDLPIGTRGLARHYRIGPAQRPLDDPSIAARLLAFDGIGLRPYAPAHLRARREGAGLALNWIRRARIDGDSWAGAEVPLGEDAERYLLRIRDAGGLRREVTLEAPNWRYDDLARAQDGTTGPYQVEVAQISGPFGPGAFTRIEIDG